MAFRMFLANLRGARIAARDARVRRLVARDLELALAGAGAGTGPCDAVIAAVAARDARLLAEARERLSAAAHRGYPLP